MNFQNPIWVVGKVEDRPMFVDFTARLSHLMETTKAGDQLTVFINSGGGGTKTCLGIYDLLKGCERNVIGFVTGRAESGASLILQGCSRRIMTRHSTLLLHRGKIEIAGSVEDCQAFIDVSRRHDEEYFAIYAERAGMKVARISEIAHRDIHFNSQEALETGLIDEIW